MLKHITKITEIAHKFTSDRRGVTAMEYGIIAALVAVVVIGTVTTLGARLNNIFSTVSNAL